MAVCGAGMRADSALGPCLQSTMVSIESSFQPSGKLLSLCVEVLAGEADLARFDLMCRAARGDALVDVLVAILVGRLAIAPGLAAQITHGPVGAMHA